MRTIKFRAWHKERQQMVSWEVIDNFLMGKAFVVVEKPITDKDPSTFYTDYHPPKNLFTSKDFEFMQFTGLKDKNGKEIYEGDIVECGDWVPDAHCLNTWENVVKWDIDTASFIGVDGEENRVIGNIYENPKLVGT
jgi:uncharacterized phage protein (TIGR01671 family)